MVELVLRLARDNPRCGYGDLKALRILKRRLSDVVYQALSADVIARPPCPAVRRPG